MDYELTKAGGRVNWLAAVRSRQAEREQEGCELEMQCHHEHGNEPARPPIVAPCCLPPCVLQDCHNFITTWAKFNHHVRIIS